MAENIVKTQPTAAALHIDRPLTDVSVAYIQNQDDFIADKVFKPIKSDRQSNMYYIFEKEYFFRGGDELQVAETSGTLGGGFGLTTGTYVCKVYGTHELISDEMRANADEGINLDHTATLLITSRLLITKEKEFAKVAFNKDAWSFAVDGASAAGAKAFKYWSDDESNPINDIRKAKMAVKRRTGYTPNTLVISEAVFERLTQHPKIIDRYKYTTANVITAEMIAKLLDLKTIEVAKAIALPNAVAEKSTAAKDNDNYTWIMENGALLLYVPDSVSVMQAASGYGFYWTGLAGVGTSEKGVAIKTYRMEHKRADVVEGLCSFAYKIICEDLGYFFNGCLEEV